jgi:hypothetical protein
MVAGLNFSTVQELRLYYHFTSWITYMTDKHVDMLTELDRLDDIQQFMQ